MTQSDPNPWVWMPASNTDPPAVLPYSPVTAIYIGNVLMAAPVKCLSSITQDPVTPRRHNLRQSSSAESNRAVTGAGGSSFQPPEGAAAHFDCHLVRAEYRWHSSFTLWCLSVASVGTGKGTGINRGCDTLYSRTSQYERNSVTVLVLYLFYESVFPMNWSLIHPFQPPKNHPKIPLDRTIYFYVVYILYFLYISLYDAHISYLSYRVNFWYIL